MGLTTLTHTNTWTDTNITFSWGTKRFFLCSMVFSRNKNCTTRLPNYSFHFSTRMYAGSSREQENGLNEKSYVETGFEPQLFILRIFLIFGNFEPSHSNKPNLYKEQAAHA